MTTLLDPDDVFPDDVVPADVASHPVGAGRVVADRVVAEPRPARFSDVLRSEWTKARSVPSTTWTLIVAIGLGIGLSALFSALAAHAYANGTGTVRATWDPTSVSDSGGSIAQLAIGVLGTLLITSEYSTRAIRSSLAAVPRRGRFLAAKSVVIAVAAFAAGEVVTFVSFFIGQALISGDAPTANLGQPGVLRALFGGGLYLVLIGLLGMGLGTIVRSAAGAISALVAILYVLPALALALPTSLAHTVEKYWPTQAGQQVVAVVRTPHTVTAWTGLAIMAVFVAVVVAVAAFELDRRDA